MTGNERESAWRRWATVVTLVETGNEDLLAIRSSRDRYVTRLAAAMTCGAVAGISLSAYAVLVAVRNPSALRGASLTEVVVGYAIGATAAGTVVGLLAPIGKRGEWWARLVGAVAGAVAVPLLAFPWIGDLWQFAAMMGAVGGAAYAPAYYDQRSKRAYAAWKAERGLVDE